MSQKQKLSELRQLLSKWKSHNEVHAKPADNMLYEFLSELLKLADHDEESESTSHRDSPTITPPIQESPHAANEDADADDGGGNNPEPPNVP